MQRRHFAYLFRVADVAIQTDVHKMLSVSTPRSKCPMKARAPLAYILKSFSSGDSYECPTKVYFLLSVADFAELAHNYSTESEIDLNYQ